MEKPTGGQRRNGGAGSPRARVLGSLTISGHPMKLGPGDVGYIGSNEIHNAKNVGTVRAQYFIVNIGRDDV